PPSCTCPHARWNGTCARYSPSSASPRAVSCLRHCRPAPTARRRDITVRSVNRFSLFRTERGVKGPRTPPHAPVGPRDDRVMETAKRADLGKRAVDELLGRRDECAALDRLVADVLAGASRVLVLRGEAGVGKSALLVYLSGQVIGWQVASAVGVESEMDLAYSGLHQLCAPLLDHLDELPVRQRDALAAVFGLSAGPAADRVPGGL